MPRRTTTSYAILGLLALKPWTTYELAKQVQRSLNWFWPREERKLYDEPKGLVADGFAAARAEKRGSDRGPSTTSLPRVATSWPAGWGSRRPRGPPSSRAW